MTAAEPPPPSEPIFNVPGVVLALVAALAITHVLLWHVLATDDANELLAQLSFIPLRYGDAILPGLPSWWGPQAWSFVSYALIHANVNHLIFNLIWLFAFGPPIARRFGTARFLAFFAATAAAGALVFLIVRWGERAWMVGASAAISGTMAAAMRFVFQRGGPLGMIGASTNDASYRVPAPSLVENLRDPRVLIFLAVWFGVNILFGVGAVQLPGAEGTVAWEAHIGGFVAGLLAFALFDPIRRAETAIDAPVVPDDLAPSEAPPAEVRPDEDPAKRP